MSSNRKPTRRNATPRRNEAPRRREAAARAQEPEGERLQKVLAAAGVGSRRVAEQMIEEGRVSVDGRVVRVQGMRVDPERARVEVDGKRIHVGVDHEYLVLNKPAGVVTTVQDPQGRPTVMKLVRSKRRVYPVGRLDAETMGLLLLTDHGELTHRLTHPRYEVPRVYVAEVRGTVDKAAVDETLRGVRLEDGIARAKEIKILRTTRTRSHLEVTMTEGRKREVRRLLDAVGHPVTSLVRVRFGPIELGALPSGAVRALTPAEVGRLLASVGL